MGTICGTLDGASGLATAIVAVIGFLAVAWVLIRTPTRAMSFSARSDAWLSNKIGVMKLLLWPRHWLESRLERSGVAQAVVRAWGVVFGLIGLSLLAVLLVAVVNPC